jgi:broad specificity phosphatase PhoE
MVDLEWLGIIRHGESTGNIAASRAEAEGAEVIDIPERDADVPLSPTGQEQAAAVGRWLAGVPAAERPEVAVVSPYRRAVQTAEALLAGAGLTPVYDERLRDRELGILDLLTGRGVRNRFPAEAARRDRLGKFYHRPPGGESWADVALRVRSLLRDVTADHPGGRVLFVSHDALVWLLRYVVENMHEAELMAVARTTPIANCSVTSWRRVDGVLVPELFNHVEHLRREGAEPTRQENVGADTH